jgi:hypothetical protein
MTSSGRVVAQNATGNLLKMLLFFTLLK